MNIFIRELKANFKSLLIWGVIVLLFIWIGFSKFTAYYGNPELLAIFDSMPAAVMAAFQFEAFNLTTVTGFFGVMFIYFALILSIAAAMWGSDIITKEVRDKTVEFSLTLPVSRGRLVTAKILAALVNCIGLMLITIAGVLLHIGKYQPDAEFFAFMRLSMVAIFIMQLIFLALGIFLACALKQHKRASSTAVSIILATYFISVIIGLDDKLDPLKYISPFAYFNPAELLHGARFEPIFLALAAGIIALSIIGAYAAYARRDLYL